MTNVDTLVESAGKLNILLDKDEIDRFILYKKILKEWNEKINITAIKDDEEIDIKHFLDSITLLDTGLFDEKIRVIDIGTGGGFPGIPIKILRDNMELVLLDSLKKRISFLDEVVDRLELKGVKTIHGRAEDYGKDKKYRENFHIATSRAVASLDVLCEYTLPFVKIGGYFIAMKGEDIEGELKEAKNSIKTLGGSFKEKVFIKLPDANIVHSLIIIEKIKETPPKFPRQAGKPKKKPL
ncbi:16S rRNA (guanine(527)-N(7))-methyltransferase RsmG [Anaerosalibacter massiliensis]|uniref:Ribosomal RNA small subunit methyltransferase G n=1 Tax=Anaerosalibacter massiliensis TaxID=1347392 RepID=A0A9X2S6A5_9FIRM|nr:16S rRNA (guanine(527)-N(7))-methyltransferase RsmG [Anaerosalibacter massiliensis]MCR2045450.1 16S rRNA (guanine(527)-N(7))-methyltransferase RsmG [Anaerosalibacter massiliensis]